MAKIIGNLVAEDDYTHPLGPEANFNESMYFNFFDPGNRWGGFVRLGNRANEGRAEMTVAIYRPDGRALFMFKRPTIENNDRFDAGGLSFDVIEPGQRLRTVYRGSVLDLAEPRVLTDPKAAFTTNPAVKIELDLEHDAVGPMYGGSQSKEESDRPAEQQFGKAHYEQHMAVTGTLKLGDETIPIRGHGLRDHSWGPRYWQAIAAYEWLTMNFGPDLGVMVSTIRRDADHVRRGGVIVRGDEMEPIVWADVTAEYEPGTPFHKTVRADVETAKGERLRIDGSVMGFIPLRNRREGVTTQIGEGMTEWRLGDRVGYGLSEFLRTLETPSGS
ncbi:MAG: hypothetical protein FJ144_08120 [Deltaproteobacteria bacterium]|nr:hypothetical protein [Deltaproteobacteria bacterium]